MCWTTNRTCRHVLRHVCSSCCRFDSNVAQHCIYCIHSLVMLLHADKIRFACWYAMLPLHWNVCRCVEIIACTMLHLGPGGEGTQAKQDMEDFVSWDIDHIKVDGCQGFDSAHQNASYAIVGSFLQDAVKKRGTGPVVYHPSNLGFEYPRQFRELATIANQWRFFNDVQDSWDSVAGIIQILGAGQPNCKPGLLPVNCTGRLRGDQSLWCAKYCVERDEFLRVPGKGGWHDPDMLLVGETPCSAAATKAGMKCSVLPLVEQETQMAIWSMVSAPLLLSADLTSIPNNSMALLTNQEALAINQDSLGRMAFRFYSNGTSGIDMWRKDLAGGDVALAIVNMNTNAGNATRPSNNPKMWASTPGKIYSDDECPNVGIAPDCNPRSGASRDEMAACCEIACLGNEGCTAFNFNYNEGHCNMRGCSSSNAANPTWQDGPSWTGYHLVGPKPPAPAPPPYPAGIRVPLANVGYAFNTGVLARNVLKKADVGVFTGTFVTPDPIPAHGVLWFRLAYSPQYATYHAEL